MKIIKFKGDITTEIANSFKNSVAIEIYGDYDRDFVSYDFKDTKKFFDNGDLKPLAEAIFESAFRLVFYGEEEGVDIS